MKTKFFAIGSYYRKILLASSVCILNTPLFSAVEVTPELTLSPEEIRVIEDNDDYFFRMGIDEENRVWDRTERKYSRHHLGNRDQFYDFKDVVRKTLADGFPVRYKVEDLYRAGMSRHISWGGVVPRVSLTLGEGASPVDLNNAFVNLFGFVMPHHWMRLATTYKGHEAMKFLFMKTALDEMFNAQQHYIKIHKAIFDFEIINFYFIHLQLLARRFPEIDRGVKTITANFGNKGSQMARKRGETKILFDNLARVMALEYLKRRAQNSRDKKSYDVSRLNIRNLRDLPEVVNPDLLPDDFKNKEEFVRLVVSKSVELRALKIYYEIAKLNVGITASGNILSNKDAHVLPPSGEHELFGITFGYDTFPRILSSLSRKRTAKIDVQDQYLKMLDFARRSHDLFTNMIGLYTESKRSLRLNREAFKDNLAHLIDAGGQADGFFLQSFENMLEAELTMNIAYHNALEALYFMRRLSVVDEDNVLPIILKTIPDINGTRATINRFMSDNYAENSPYYSHIDEIASRLATVKDLSYFLEGKIINPDGVLEKIEDSLLHDAILLNINDLISNLGKFKLTKKRKSKKFYIKLHDYILEHNLVLDEYNSRRLSKKAGRPFDGDKYRHDLEFVDLDGKTNEPTRVDKWRKAIEHKFKSHNLKVNGKDYFKEMRRLQEGHR